MGAWLLNGDSSPFESPAYLESLYGQGASELANSERFFEEAGKADDNGDNYEIAAMILTVVLFFAGISLVVRARGVTWALLGISGLLLIGTITYMTSLPLA